MAITTNNSISVKALTRSRNFGNVNTEEVLFIFIGICFEVARLISFFTDKVNNNFLDFLRRSFL
jgi:hypothetical protein